MINNGLKGPSRNENVFAGLSSLREQERKKEDDGAKKKIDTGMQVRPIRCSGCLSAWDSLAKLFPSQDYLKRYTSGTTEQSDPSGVSSREYQVKKKKKSQPSSHAAIRIVDHDETIRIKSGSDDRSQHRLMKRGREGADEDEDEEDCESRPRPCPSSPDLSPPPSISLPLQSSQ